MHRKALLAIGLSLVWLAKSPAGDEPRTYSLKKLTSVASDLERAKASDWGAICAKLQGENFKDEMIVQGFKKRAGGSKTDGAKYDLFLSAKLRNDWKLTINLLVAQEDIDQIKKGDTVEVTGTFSDSSNVAQDTKKLWWRLINGTITVSDKKQKKEPQKEKEKEEE